MLDSEVLQLFQSKKEHEYAIYLKIYNITPGEDIDNKIKTLVGPIPTDDT